MASRGQALTISYVAWNTSTNTGQTGDVANHTLRWVQDGTSLAPTNGPTEIDAVNAPGAYRQVLTAAECTINSGLICGKSSTANVVLIPQQFTFEWLPAAAPGSGVGALPTLDGSGRLPANLTAIDNNATNGNNATLNLKQMNIVNATGDALVASSTGGNGRGVNASGNGTGEGIKAGGGANGGSGINASGGAANSYGIVATGAGSGAGGRFSGGATGSGVLAIGGTTSGAGISISTTAGDGIMVTPTAGHGVNLAANGSGKHGLLTTGGTGGTSDGIRANAGIGGVDIRGNITGNLLGTVSVVTTYTGNTPQTGDLFALLNPLIAAGAFTTIALAAAPGGGPVVLAASQPNYAPAQAGNAMALTTGERVATAAAIWSDTADFSAPTAGSAAAKLNASGAAGNPWTVDLALGGYTGTQAGAILEALDLDVPMSFRPQTGLTAPTRMDALSGTWSYLFAAGAPAEDGSVSIFDPSGNIAIFDFTATPPLSPNSLDLIAVSDPGPVASGWNTLPKLIAALGRRWFGPATRTLDPTTGAGAIQLLPDTGTTPNATQFITDDGAGNETQGKMA
jgi:hypothetical protein